MSESVVRGKKARIQPGTLRAALGASRLFVGLPPESLDRMAEAMKLVTLANEQLVRGDTNTLWFVVRGALRMTLITDEAPSPTLIVFGAGSFYNIAAFFGQPSTPTECHAVGQTEVGVLESPALRRLIAADVDLAARAGKLLMDRLTATVSLYNDVISAPVPQRLARRLLTQALTTGGMTGETEVRVSQGMLADMVGISRTRVSEELRLLEEAGVLRLGYRRLYIRDMAKLCELAGPGVTPL